MNDPQFEDPNNASNCLAIAEQIVETIDALIDQSSDYDNLKVLLAHCARQLGLHVVV
jgi:hypothetical protein